MTTNRPIRLGAALLAVALGGAAVAEDMEEYRSMFEPLPFLPPIPPGNSMTREKIELGAMLFFEPRISASGVISCATCHNPALGWSDRIGRAVGHEGQVGVRNTPTVLNSGFLTSQFWDGREADLEGQALGPIQADVEMNMTLDQAIARINELTVYRTHFDAAFPGEEDPINAQNVALAIATFERTLNTPDSPFDRFLRGDAQAISDEAKEGIKLFVDNGCVACHSGPVMSDGLFHRFEVPGSTDEGRFVVTGDEADMFTFRTPTLRNVAVTYPYFNNGSVTDLRDAVNLMGEQMLGHAFTDPELDHLVAFLHTLTGKMPVVPVPALP
ncbi:c-type cytochrome [Paracoccus liaowanqingii]|uniref:Methylamine utilization protein MauG n=1 Tax=Paracoccus liaowanqingii TaxID=2560053 RepID=A0A4P7HI19_9RHOB|nr:cytochrome c peroxidase [Paracoccus liaowanqingii]QBX33699.1 c-type cytochrome [Paracoccus liaowanqingii]